MLDTFFILANAGASESSHGVILLLVELMIVAAVALAVKYVKLPYTIALVAAGLSIGILRAQHYVDLDLHLTPDLVFVIFLPALLFEAALNLHFHSLKENIRPVLILAIVGVLMAAFGVAYSLHFLVSLPLAAALVFGALISATDPISVLAIFKELKAPSRINILVEGESLLNDGAAVVIFKIILAFAITGEFSVGTSVLTFLVVSLGGLAIGSATGYLVSQLTRHVDDHLIEITLSTILAYGSYLAAEHFGASGVMSVIAAGIVFGNFGRRVGMSPNTRMMMGVFWEYIGFLMNSLVFLLIGTQVNLSLLAGEWKMILVAFVVVIVVRALVIALLAPIFRLVDKPIPFSWHGVLVWAGLRGSISMALAMGLPASLPYRDDIILMTFGVVILSLFLQGLTMPSLLRMLKIIGVSQPVYEYEQRLGKVLVHDRALVELKRLKDGLFLRIEPYEELAKFHQEQLDLAEKSLEELGEGEECILEEQKSDAEKIVRMAQVASLHEALDRGLISDEAMEYLIDYLAQEEVAEIEEHREHKE
jgi:Na+:H+ antiporter